MGVQRKRCRHCGKTRAAVHFWRASGARDGLQSWCRECSRVHDASPQRRAARRQYQGTTRGRAVIAAGGRRYEQSAHGKAARRARRKTPEYREQMRRFRERYEKSPKRLAYLAGYRESPAGKAKVRAAAVRQRARWPMKVRARDAVNHALATGRLVRPSRCARRACRKACRPQAHHHRGYGRRYWLVVTWLCVTCHARADRRP